MFQFDSDRWNRAGSPDFLLAMAHEIEQRTPRSVIECGSGVSTLVCARILQMQGRGHVYSLEHDALYAEETRRLLFEYGLKDWATVFHAPLDTDRTVTPWYSEKLIPKELANVEVVVVDGPPSGVAPLARYPALPRLIGRIISRARAPSRGRS